MLIRFLLSSPPVMSPTSYITYTHTIMLWNARKKKKIFWTKKPEPTTLLFIFFFLSFFFRASFSPSFSHTHTRMAEKGFYFKKTAKITQCSLFSFLVCLFSFAFIFFWWEKKLKNSVLQYSNLKVVGGFFGGGGKEGMKSSKRVLSYKGRKISTWHKQIQRGGGGEDFFPPKRANIAQKLARLSFSDTKFFAYFCYMN